MKKLLTISILFSTFAASAAAAEVITESYQYRGSGASGRWESTDGECERTTAFFSGAEAVEGVSDGKPTTYERVLAVVVRYNDCTGEIQFSGFGIGTVDSVDINGFTSASVSVPMRYGTCTYDSCTVSEGTFTATLIGTGEPLHVTSMSTWQEGTIRAGSHYNGWWREATVSGSATMDDVELFGGDFTVSSGELSHTNTGGFWVSRDL